MSTEKSLQWPRNHITPEEIKELKESNYDELEAFDKLRYIFAELQEFEIPSEDNTSLKRADEKIQSSLDEIAKIFELFWYVVKEDDLLFATYKCMKSINLKKDGVYKFKNRLYKMRKHQEWLKKKESMKSRYTNKNRYR